MIGRIAGIVLWVLLVVQAAGLGAAGPTTQPTDPAAARALAAGRPAVVQVLAYDDSGRLLRRGSGFAFTEDRMLVTERAVVDHAKFVSAVVRDGNAVAVNVIHLPDAAPRLALLKLQYGGELVQALKLAAAAPPAGTEVYVAGSADGLDTAVLTTAIAGGDPAALRLTQAVDPGMAGGPVLTAAGEVCGVALSGGDGAAAAAGQVEVWTKAAATGKGIELHGMKGPELKGRGPAVTFEALMGEVPQAIWPAGATAWPPPFTGARGASRPEGNWMDLHVKQLNQWIREQARGRALRIRGQYHGSHGFPSLGYLGVHLEPVYVTQGNRRFVLLVAIIVEDTEAFAKAKFREGEAVEAVGVLDSLFFRGQAAKLDRSGNPLPVAGTVPTWLHSSFLLRGEVKRPGR